MILLRVGRIFGRAGDALLVDGGRIVEVGSFAELNGRAGVRARREFPEALLLPGIHDTHMHFYEYARRLHGVDCTSARNVEELEALLRDHRRRAPAEGWLGGSGWDPGRYGDDPRVHRPLLDEIYGDQPISLESRDFHTLWCNAAALRLAGVFDGAEAPPGGRIGRDAGGEPDGFLYETAWDLIWAVRPPEEDATARVWIRGAAAAVHRLGITTIHSMEPNSTLEHLRAMDAAGELGLRVCFHTPLDRLEERIEAGERSYAPARGHLRLGGVKVFMDGSLGSRSAWMHAPYPDGSHGDLLRPIAELDRILERAAAAGIAGSVHAIGDRCVEEVAAALARAAPRGALRHRIEHAQCATPRARAILRDAGILCAMQPVHLLDDIPLLEREWGAASHDAYPLRSMVDEGIGIGLGSDAPVATPDWRAGVWAAVRRQRDANGVQHRVEQALRLDEALRGYTEWAARLGGYEDESGRIDAGCAADLCVLEDPGENLDAWREAKVQATMLDGEFVYES